MKNKYLLLLPLLLFSLSFICAIDISNCQELQNMNNDLTANYVLINDIDCSDTINWNIEDCNIFNAEVCFWASSWGCVWDGENELCTGIWNGSEAGFIPVGDVGNGFEGTLDGQGYSINNLYINGGDDKGLFGRIVGQGSVSNVNLENINIIGGSYVGGIVGYFESGTIISCSSSGDVTGTGSNIGGIIGYKNNQGEIYNSYSTGDVRTTNGFQAPVGGLIGNSAGGTINNCYATGSVTGDVSWGIAGGLIGYATNTAVDTSYSTGVVTGSAASGGFVGSGGTGNNIQNSFWDINTSGRTGNNCPYSPCGTGKTTIEMKTISTFTGWIIQELDGENDYPFLSNGIWMMYQPADYQGPLGIFKVWEWDKLNTTIDAEQAQQSLLTEQTMFAVEDAQPVEKISLFTNIINWLKGLFQ